MSKEQIIEDVEHIDLTKELEAETPKVSYQTDNSFADEDGENDAYGDEDAEYNDDAFEADDEPENEPITKAQARTIAKQLVADLSAIQKTALESFVYPNTILRKEDFRLAKEYKDGLRSDDHSAALDRLLNYEKKINELPFTKEEREQIANPLASVIMKYQRIMNLGPEFSLVLAVFLVMLPRLEPMFTSMFSPKKP